MGMREVIITFKRCEMFKPFLKKVGYYLVVVDDSLTLVWTGLLGKHSRVGLI